VELEGQTAIPREASSGGNPGSAVPVVYGVLQTGREPAMELALRHGLAARAGLMERDTGCAHSCRAHHASLADIGACRDTKQPSNESAIAAEIRVTTFRRLGPSANPFVRAA